MRPRSTPPADPKTVEGGTNNGTRPAPEPAHLAPRDRIRRGAPRSPPLRFNICCCVIFACNIQYFNISIFSIFVAPRAATRCIQRTMCPLPPLPAHTMTEQDTEGARGHNASAPLGPERGSQGLPAAVHGHRPPLQGPLKLRTAAPRAPGNRVSPPPHNREESARALELQDSPAPFPASPAAVASP